MKLKNLIKREKIKISTYPHKKIVNIFADIIGEFLAVHKTLHNKKLFTVTHIPSGTSVETGFQKIEYAIDWAIGFDKMFSGKELEFSQTNGKKHSHFKEIHDIYKEEREG